MPSLRAPVCLGERGGSFAAILRTVALNLAFVDVRRNTHDGPDAVGYKGLTREWTWS
jgi:hypothetical protein